MENYTQAKVSKCNLGGHSLVSKLHSVARPGKWQKGHHRPVAGNGSDWV